MILVSPEPNRQLIIEPTLTATSQVDGLWFQRKAESCSPEFADGPLLLLFINDSLTNKLKIDADDAKQALGRHQVRHLLHCPSARH